MGAAAFLMIEFAGVPYWEIAKAATIPAILYFSGIWIMTHLEAKKQAKQKKTSKKGEIKEVRLKPFMAEGDFQVKVKKIKKFLKQGNQIRISIQFKGRELAHKNFGYDLFAKLVKELSDLVKVDQEPKFIGRRILATISPGSGQKTAIHS